MSRRLAPNYVPFVPLEITDEDYENAKKEAEELQARNEPEPEPKPEPEPEPETDNTPKKRIDISAPSYTHQVMNKWADYMQGLLFHVPGGEKFIRVGKQYWGAVKSALAPFTPPLSSWYSHIWSSLTKRYHAHPHSIPTGYQPQVQSYDHEQPSHYDDDSTSTSTSNSYNINNNINNKFPHQNFPSN